MLFSTEPEPVDGPRFPASIEEAVGVFGYPVATLVTPPWLGPVLETARYDGSDLVDVRLKFDLDRGHAVVRTTKRTGSTTNNGLLDLTLRTSMAEMLMSFEPNEKWGARHGAERWRFAQQLHSLPSRSVSVILEDEQASAVVITRGENTAIGLTTATTHVVIGLSHTEMHDIKLSLIYPPTR